MKSIVIVMLLLTATFAREPDFIVKRSLYSVDKTLNRFKKIAKERGFKIISVIDHQKLAKKAGLRMHSQKVLLFSAPKSATRLMNSNPLLGIEMPLKISVYKDRGKVKLAYKNPAYYEKAFRLKGHKVIKYFKKELKFMSNEAIN